MQNLSSKMVQNYSKLLYIKLLYQLVASRPSVLATDPLFKLQIAREVIQNVPKSYKSLQSHQMKQVTRNQVKCNLNANKLGFNESTGT